MKLGWTPLGAALGQIAAHSLHAGGARIAKGTRLTAAMIEEIAASGISEVFAACLDPDDVLEDEAAARLAAGLINANISCSEAEHGRVNFYAGCNGLFRPHRARIDDFNQIDEAITLATLPENASLRRGDVLATLKIIPFAIENELLLRAAATLQQGAPAMEILPFAPLRVSLLLTENAQLKASVLDATLQVTRARVERRGGVLGEVRRSAHRAAAIAPALQALLGQGCDLVLIAGASAVAGAGDEVPQAIALAGGAVHHFGMPADPGNLLCLGEHGSTQIVILPGCARSKAKNGIDLVLDRIFAGLPVDRRAISSMGVGGLLKDTSARPEPRTALRPVR